MYVLKKGENPELKVGEVIFASTPAPKYPTSYGQPGIEMVVTIKVRIDGEEVEYQNLPANATIADFGNGMVVSESSDAMLSEVESAQRQSQNIVDSIDFHKNAVKGYETIRKSLCPQYAKDAKQEERIGKLENGIKEIKDLLAEALAKINN